MYHDDACLLLQQSKTERAEDERGGGAEDEILAQASYSSFLRTTVARLLA
jgi:hypothetical protein